VSATQPQGRTYADLIADCVHCGFCLPACPTYVSWGEEMDSPRGRIDLMKGVEQGAIPLDATVAGHIDACLGCMACVTACPSGVRYDLLIEETRARVEAQVPRGAADRAFRALVFALFPYPRRLRVLALPLLAYARSGLQSAVRRSGVLRLLPRRLAQLDALLPPLRARDAFADVAEHTAARVLPPRGTVTLVAGCVQRAFFPNVNAATVRVLAAEGFDVRTPRAQGCCGALSLHAGRTEEAKRFARKLIVALEGDGTGPIVVNAAGCGSTLKEYGQLLDADPAWRTRAAAFAARVRDINEFLAAVPALAPRHPLNLRVAYHDACHLAHAQRIREQPRALLRSIPALEVVEIPRGEQCCGSAGVYNLLEPESAAEIGARKADNLLTVGAAMLASANPGCTLQIAAALAQRGIRMPTAHPIEILDRSIAGTSGEG
jgi:glycolate oxidase iron-sulfur subunit